MMNYKLYKAGLGNAVGIIRFNDDGSITSFAQDPANTDYQAFLAWKAEGNEPLPADEGEQA
jgi:hypothetical protein